MTNETVGQQTGRRVSNGNGMKNTNESNSGEHVLMFVTSSSCLMTPRAELSYRSVINLLKFQKKSLCVRRGVFGGTNLNAPSEGNKINE